jgi:thiol-disulfide isomerase/thioredoxin
MSETWRVVMVLLALGVVVEAVFLVAVMRQVGSLLLVVGTTRPLDLPVGPKIGEVQELPGYERGRPVLVAFVSPDCQQCRSLLPGFRRLQTAYGDQLELIAVVSHADAQARTKYAREIGTFARTDLPALMQDWEVPGTPFAVALDASHRVRGTGIVNTLDQLETLAVTALAIAPASEQPDHGGENGAADAFATDGDRRARYEEVVQ